MGFLGKSFATLWLVISLGQCIIRPDIINTVFLALVSVWWMLYLFKGQFASSKLGLLYTAVNAAVWIISLLML